MYYSLISKICAFLGSLLVLSFVLTLLFGTATWSGALTLLFFISILLLGARYYRNKAQHFEAYIEQLEK